MFQQRGGRIKIRIGGRVPFANWHDGHTSAKDLAERFRRHVYRPGQSKPGCSPANRRSRCRKSVWS